MADRAIMPIMGATLLSEVPWGFVSPHDAQAQRNHCQSLERLAQRGGLAASEAIDIVTGQRWATTDPGIDSERRLINMVREWRASGAKHC